MILMDLLNILTKNKIKLYNNNYFENIKINGNKRR